MKQYILKDALVAEIERIMNEQQEICKVDVAMGKNPNSKNIEVIFQFQQFVKFLDSLEAKEVETWHLKEKEDIYDAVKDWSLHTFACIMKDGTIQKFTGCRCEDFEGHINTHIDGVNDDYDDVDDIVKWIEYT